MGTTADKLMYLNDTKSDIKAALIEKGQSVSNGDTFRSYADKIRNITVGDDEKVEKIFFRDYDGTVLYSYTVEQFKTLTSLPTPPSHDGLIFQGWNWTLSAIKSEERAIEVGAVYITVSGKSEFDITLNDVTGLTVTVKVYIPTSSIPYSTIVEWGDGTTDTSSVSSNTRTISHTYTTIGQYTISIDSAIEYGLYNDCMSPVCTEIRLGIRCTTLQPYALRNQYILKNITIPNNVTSIGDSAFASCYTLLHVTIPNGITSIAASLCNYCYSLKSTSIPNSVTSIMINAFQQCNTLTNVTIPNNVTNIYSYAFQYCYLLSGNITIPSSVTSLGDNIFQQCRNLKSVIIQNGITSLSSNIFGTCISVISITIPESVTSIKASSIGGCIGLSHITIPSKVTSIEASAFTGNYNVMKYTILQTTPPTLANVNAFSGIHSQCIIEVPKGTLEAYKSATNWATYANYMREAA